MRTNVVGLILSIIVGVMLLVVGPTYYAGVIQYARAQDEALSLTQHLIDTVIDTRVLTDDMIADYNIGMAALPVNYATTITRKTRVINPDPQNPGATVTTACVADDLSTWHQGDTITIEVTPINEPFFMVLARQLQGLVLSKESFSLCGRVR